MQITGTHVQYYFICHRKLWLFANGIQMEHTSDYVTEGKLIHQTTYQKRTDSYKEIAVESVRIDFYDPNKNIIHEIKKSSKVEEAHVWQLKYYIHVLRRNKIPCNSGILEYPLLRETRNINLTEDDVEILKEVEKNIQNIINSEQVPDRIKKSICKKCSYFDFCWI